MSPPLFWKGTKREAAPAEMAEEEETGKLGRPEEETVRWERAEVGGWRATSVDGPLAPRGVPSLSVPPPPTS
jgi:hypothetical protein